MARIYLASRAVLQTTLAASIANINATYRASPAPFYLDVSRRFEIETHQKLALTRFTDDLGLPLAADGPPTQNQTAVRDYWMHQYNWTQAQTNINQLFVNHQFLCDRNLTAGSIRWLYHLLVRLSSAAPELSAASRRIQAGNHRLDPLFSTIPTTVRLNRTNIAPATLTTVPTMMVIMGKNRSIRTFQTTSSHHISEIPNRSLSSLLNVGAESRTSAYLSRDRLSVKESQIGIKWNYVVTEQSYERDEAIRGRLRPSRRQRAAHGKLFLLAIGVKTIDGLLQ